MSFAIEDVVVGRIVHYHAYKQGAEIDETIPQAAVVTEVHDRNELTLCVFEGPGGGVTYKQRVFYCPWGRQGCWSWPRK